VLLPRQIAMYSIRKVTNLSYPEIGRFFGGKDHSTVIHAIKKIESLVSKDQTVKKIVDSVTLGF
jgi:chromosomal replication initiator protein